MLRGVEIAQLGQRNIASAGDEFRGVQGVAILGFLGLLLELAGLAKGRKLALLGLVEQGVRLGQAPVVEGRFRGAGEFGRMRVIRFERGQLVSRLREMLRDLDQTRRDFLLRHILLAEDFEEFDHGGRSEPQFCRQLGGFSLGLCFGLRGSGHLIGKCLRHRRQHRRVLLVDRVVDRAVADRSPDLDAFGDRAAVGRRLDRPGRCYCHHGSEEKRCRRAKRADYFFVVSRHGPAVAVPPETVLLTVEPETFPPIFTPC